MIRYFLRRRTVLVLVSTSEKLGVTFKQGASDVTASGFAKSRVLLQDITYYYYYYFYYYYDYSVNAAATGGPGGGVGDALSD